MVRWVVGSISHDGPIELFLVLVLLDWYSKRLGVCCPVCGTARITEKSGPSGVGSRFPLTEWSFTICP